MILLLEILPRLQTTRILYTEVKSKLGRPLRRMALLQKGRLQQLKAKHLKLLGLVLILSPAGKTHEQTLLKEVVTQALAQ